MASTARPTQTRTSSPEPDRSRHRGCKRKPRHNPTSSRLGGGLTFSTFSRDRTSRKRPQRRTPPRPRRKPPTREVPTLPKAAGSTRTLKARLRKRPSSTHAPHFCACPEAEAGGVLGGWRRVAEAGLPRPRPLRRASHRRAHGQLPFPGGQVAAAGFFLVLFRGFCGSPGAGMAAGRRSAGLRLCATGKGRPGAMGRARAGTLSRVGSGRAGSPASFRRGSGILRNTPGFWVLPLTRMRRGPGPGKDAPVFRLILGSVWQEVSAALTPFAGVKAPSRACGQTWLWDPPWGMARDRS